MPLDIDKERAAAFGDARAELAGARAKLGVSQESLAEALGISGGTLSGNLRRASFATYESIAKADPRFAPIAAGLFSRMADLYLAAAGEALGARGVEVAQRLGRTGAPDQRAVETLRALQASLAEALARLEGKA